MGDIGMIKGGLLAWLLCRQKGILGGVVVLKYPRRSPGSTDKKRGKKQINNSNQMQHNAWLGLNAVVMWPSALLSILEEAGKYSEIFSQLQFTIHSADLAAKVAGLIC